jgi:Tfp pilus assembly protein PilP
MQHPKNTFSSISICSLCLAMGILALLTGCQEVNTAIDSILGKRSPVLSAAPGSSPLSLVPAKKRPAGELPPVPTTEVTPDKEQKATEVPKPAQPKMRPPKPTADKKPVKAEKPAAPKTVPLYAAKGKRRAPGALAPRPKQEAVPVTPLEAPSTSFQVRRDPFKAPTEILPSECPPSMPLCRFDFSQLKLVGVIQVEHGQFKGMVEDPDGRGYFITPGMQIGGATVTQVTNKGIMLHVRKTRQDRLMPLFLEARESQEF